MPFFFSGGASLVIGFVRVSKSDGTPNRAFEVGFGSIVKPVDATTVTGVLSCQLDDLEPQLTRHGYDAKSLAEQFDARRSASCSGAASTRPAPENSPIICGRLGCRSDPGANRSCARLFVSYVCRTEYRLRLN